MNGLLTQVVVALAVAGSAPGAVQLPSRPSSPEPVFELRMGRQGRIAMARAVNVPVGELARRLGGELKIPVRASAAVARSRVTLRKVEDLSLEDFLAALEPVVAFVDSRESLNRTSELMGIALAESGATARTLAGVGAMVIEGVADDPADAGRSAKGGEPRNPDLARANAPGDGPFLRVSRAADGRIDLDAQDQGLGVLLFEVAQSAGAGFDMRIPEAPIVGRLSFRGLLPSELPAYIPFPGVGVEIRRNVRTGEQTLLRVFLDPAPKTAPPEVP